MSKPIFFATAAEWRAWLEANHATAAEFSVGFWKVGSGKPSMTWPQSVDEALCFGWIDAVRHRIDETAYRIRFMPRKAGGIWSAVNLRRFAELKAEGRIAPAGQAAHDVGQHRTGLYSYERAASELSAEQTKLFQADARAWAFFQAQPAGYRKLTIHRILAGKTPATQARRLALLIDASAQGRRMATATQMEPV
ncbi:MAG: YdeI/OmpD-associated family protein [Phenylobacterium sp.]